MSYGTGNPAYRNVEQVKRITSANEVSGKVRRDINEAIKKLENFIKLMREREEKRRKEQEKQAQKIKTMKKEVENLDQKVKEQEKAHRQEVKQIVERYDREKDEMNRVFTEQNHAMQEQINLTRDEMKRGFAEVRNEMNEGIRRVTLETEARITSVKEKFHREVQEVNGKVNSLLEELATQKQIEGELSEYWVQQDFRIINELLGHRADFFAPREFQALNRMVEDAVSDANSGSFSNAIFGGRTAFNEGLDLLEEITQKEREWQMWVEAVLNRELELLSLLEEAEGRTYELEIDGEMITDDNGLDYWTKGQFGIVKERIRKARDGITNLDERKTEELREIFDSLTGLEEEILLVENTARTNVAMAKERRDLVLGIGTLLGEEYMMTDCDGDYRCLEVNDSYHAYFKNPVTGDKVVVVATPMMESDGTVTNHIRMEMDVETKERRESIHERVSEHVDELFKDPNRPERKKGESLFPCSKPFGQDSVYETERLSNMEAVRNGTV